MSPTPASIAARRQAFHRLHDAGCFLIPNPWDVGSARWLQGLGFKALATTSSGFAWSRARPDNGITRDMALAHLADLVDATEVPVNADFESGFAHDAAGVEESVRLALTTGVAGLSIEDSTGDAKSPLYPIDEAVARLRAARRAVDQAGGDALLVGRAECFLVGRPDLEETIARLKAYANAGADCLYAPGLRDEATIAAVVQAVAPKPVNVLTPGLPVSALRALGVRRISVGGGLASAAWGEFLRAAREIADDGTFTALQRGAPGRELNGLFARGFRPET